MRGWPVWGKNARAAEPSVELQEQHDPVFIMAALGPQDWRLSPTDPVSQRKEEWIQVYHFSPRMCEMPKATTAFSFPPTYFLFLFYPFLSCLLSPPFPVCFHVSPRSLSIEVPHQFLGLVFAQWMEPQPRGGAEAMLAAGGASAWGAQHGLGKS